MYIIEYLCKLILLISVIIAILSRISKREKLYSKLGYVLCSLYILIFIIGHVIVLIDKKTIQVGDTFFEILSLIFCIIFSYTVINKFHNKESYEKSNSR